MSKSVPVAAAQTLCKVCHRPAPLYGVVDLNKNCEERRGTFLPLAGIPVYYHRCDNCGLIFSNHFDDWSPADFRAQIYNDAYITVDPEYLDQRPRHQADFIRDFIKRGAGLSVLDYGGGSGRTSALLRESGIAATSWDPMADDNALPDKTHFDLVTAFEVFEHTPAPHLTTAEVLGRLNQDGVLLFSTLIMDALPERAIHHWYIAPRNGHITIHTRKSLSILFLGFGYQVHHFDDSLHYAYRTKPAWLG